MIDRHCETLQFDVICDTMESYRFYRKDGYNDRYGKAYDTRGGGRGSTDARRNGETTLARRKAPRLQSIGAVARESIRTQSVSGRATKKTRTVGTPVLSVAPAQPNVYQALSHAVCCTTLLSILPYGNRGWKGITMQPSTLYVLWYFCALATNALLDRHYAQWQEGRK